MGILCIFLLLICIWFSLQQHSFRKVFPIHFYMIQTGSMMPEIKIGELIVVEKKQDYREGEIITYQVNQSYFVTHRIIEKTAEGFVTKGDSNNTKDETMVRKEEIQGKVIMHSKVLGIIFQHRIMIIVILLLYIIVW